MGQKGEDTRDRFLQTTVELVEASGYFGTGLNQVIAASGAPRGSLYFHFPGGKDQLIVEAVTRAGGAIAELMRGAEAPDTGAFIRQLLTRLGDRLEESGWTKGCPVATVALETAATNDALQRACADVYASWEDGIRARLRTDGHPDADDLATSTLALVEGALLLAKARRSREPLLSAGRTITALLTRNPPAPAWSST